MHPPPESGGLHGDRVSKRIPGVKIGVGHFPRELRVPPRSWCRGLGQVVFERSHDRGGHFAAGERPGDLVRDVRMMFGRGEGPEGVVGGEVWVCGWAAGRGRGGGEGGKRSCRSNRCSN